MNLSSLRNRSVFILLTIISFGGQALAADLLVGKTEAEAATTTGGPYIGLIPTGGAFSGYRFFANGDYISNVATFATVPGNYRLSIRGASTTSSAASISVFVGATKVGTVSFASTTASVANISFSLVTAPSPSIIKLLMETDNGAFDTDIDWLELYYSGAIPAPSPPPNVPSTGAFFSGTHRNLFVEAGKTVAAVNSKIDSAFNTLFYGDSANQRVYYTRGSDMAYILDVGNNDVRSEGMSYGMMIAVQLDKKSEFDKLWKFARTYMYHATGDWQGFFAWQVHVDGSVMDQGSASDGEEYFAMALMFAARRFGNGTGIYNYETEAQNILTAMLHHEEVVNQYSGIKNMFNATEKKVVFSPNSSSALFTDPSYHLPAFYELWARWSSADTAFWRMAADTSRAFFKRTVNAATGLGPDYAEFSGAPNTTGNHGDFRFDAWRIAQNIAMDYAWWARDAWQKSFADTIQSFFSRQSLASYANQYSLSGTSLSGDHSPGLVAMNAVASLCATKSTAWDFVNELWNLPVPGGQWRYYDGMLYMLGLLHVSGRFTIIGNTTQTVNDGMMTTNQQVRAKGTLHRLVPVLNGHTLIDETRPLYDIRGRKICHQQMSTSTIQVLIY